MPVHQRTWSVQLPATFGHLDVSHEVEELVRDSGVITGVAVVSLVGSTGAVTTIEYEPGALADLERALEVLAPQGDHYEHNERWGDGNGYSHVRSAVLKTSVSIPIVDRRLQLGTWQQVVVFNLDNRSRNRQIVTVVIGE